VSKHPKTVNLTKFVIHMAYRECIPCEILLKFSGFVGSSSMADPHFKFGEIHLRGSKVMGFNLGKGAFFLKVLTLSVAKLYVRFEKVREMQKWYGPVSPWG